MDEKVKNEKITKSPISTQPKGKNEDEAMKQKSETKIEKEQPMSDENLLIREILKPSCAPKKQNSDDKNKKTQKSDQVKESSSSGSSMDSIFSCHSSEYSEVNSDFFQRLKAEDDSPSSDTSDSESSENLENYHLERDNMRIPKPNRPGGVKHPCAYNFRGERATRYSEMVPASKKMHDIHMKRALITDSKLPNYEQTSEEREILKAQGIDFVLNQFGEIIKLEQISEAELKQIIGKKSLMTELMIPEEDRPKPKVNMFKKPKTKPTKQQKSDGFQEWLNDRKRGNLNRTLNPDMIEHHAANHESRLQEQISRRNAKRAVGGFANRAYDREIQLSSVDKKNKLGENYARMVKRDKLAEYEAKWEKIKEILIGPEPKVPFEDYDENPRWLKWSKRAKELKRKWKLENELDDEYFILDWEVTPDRSNDRLAYTGTDFWDFSYGNMPLNESGTIVLDEQAQFVYANNPDIRADLIHYLEQIGVKRNADFLENSTEAGTYWRSLLKIWRELLLVSFFFSSLKRHRILIRGL